ncbi:MAG: hypothetical protein IJL64_07775 [Bacteroidales bacterium]|nr:hypothetical protein [Bacteroidales bacterium]
MDPHQEIDRYRNIRFTGKNRRLMYEWTAMDARFRDEPDIAYTVRRRNADHLPTMYEVVFKVRSFCGVLPADGDGWNRPVFGDVFRMVIQIPNNYPAIDSKLEFRFLTTDGDGREIPHPWHPNIRYYGDFAGHVCLNTPACGTFTDLAWYVDRVMLYLKYEKYHAQNTPPFPEDLKVAEWVLEQAEPNGWIKELRNNLN